MAAFGVEFLNGVVEDPDRWDPAEFLRSDGTLVDHAITEGLSPEDRLTAVATFDGSALSNAQAR